MVEVYHEDKTYPCKTLTTKNEVMNESVRFDLDVTAHRVDFDLFIHQRLLSTSCVLDVQWQTGPRGSLSSCNV